MESRNLLCRQNGNPYMKYIEQEMSSCMLCPRKCGVNRLKGQTGFCGMTAGIVAARAALHFWEEPCISGIPDYEDTRQQSVPEKTGKDRKSGSGAVFFSGCNLRCAYCQNGLIAEGRSGRIITPERLSEIFLELQNKGACNINLVTPTPFIPQIAAAVFFARENGLSLPVVFNCGGYESVDALRMLDGIVDIFLTDFKYMNEELAARYSKAPDYPGAVKAALDEMVRQIPETVFDCDGNMTRGVIVRHLLLPGNVRNAKAIAEYVYSRYGSKVWLSMMRQYTPVNGVEERFPELGRRVTGREYGRLLDYVSDLGVENCYIQDGGTAVESFIPAFDGEGV